MEKAFRKYRRKEKPYRHTRTHTNTDDRTGWLAGRLALAHDTAKEQQRKPVSTESHSQSVRGPRSLCVVVVVVVVSIHQIQPEENQPPTIGREKKKPCGFLACGFNAGHDLKRAGSRDSGRLEAVVGWSIRTKSPAHWWWRPLPYQVPLGVCVCVCASSYRPTAIGALRPHRDSLRIFSVKCQEGEEGRKSSVEESERKLS